VAQRQLPIVNVRELPRVLQTAILVPVRLFAHRVPMDIILAAVVVMRVPQVAPVAQVQVIA